MKRGVIIAALATVGAIALNGILRVNPGEKPWCARAPSDGGTCAAKLADGGVVAIGMFSVTHSPMGQCEIFICPKEP